MQLDNESNTDQKNVNSILIKLIRYSYSYAMPHLKRFPIDSILFWRVVGIGWDIIMVIQFVDLNGRHAVGIT